MRRRQLIISARKRIWTVLSAGSRVYRAISAQSRVLPSTALSRSDSEALHEAITRLVRELPSLADALSAVALCPAVRDAGKASGKPRRPDVGAKTLRLRLSSFDASLRSVLDFVLADAQSVARRLQRTRDKLSEATKEAKIPAASGSKLLADLGLDLDRALALRDTVEALLHEDDPHFAPRARWLEERPAERTRHRWLVVSPVDVAGLLRELLWTRIGGAIVTSATLTSFGSFDHLAHSTGLSGADRVSYARLDSPFDLARQATLIVPAMRSDPSDADAHTAELIALLPSRLDPAEGSLVLFFSDKQMREVYAGMPTTWRQRIACQGDRDREALLAEHALAIAAGGGHALFGLVSMAEGLDLPLDLCRHVVIAKLPFPVPDDPVEATRAEWMASRGQSYFAQVALPLVALRLTQACGRLIRTPQDVGRITVFDRRLVTKPYGKQLLAALPPFRQVIEPALDPDSLPSAARKVRRTPSQAVTQDAAAV